jgi:glycosyltransferase involved in cell wall biosynthesis
MLTNNGTAKVPLVSVCIITYQHAPYIRQCIDSVLKQQTDFFFEIILGEDESNDGTRAICIEYSKRYPEIIKLYLRRRQDVVFVNGNPTGRFNFVQCIKAAAGKFIAVCEGDDYWSDMLKLQKQVDFLNKNPDCIACHHWHEILMRNKDGVFQLRPALKEGFGYYPATKATVAAIFSNELRVKLRTIMFRNIISDFPQWYFRVAFGDVPLSMILGKHGSFGFIDEPMAVYRQTGVGLSASGIGHWLYTYNHYLEWVKIWEYADEYFESQFRKAVLSTIRFFYSAIFNKYRHSFRVFLKTAHYAFFQSRLPLLPRCRMIAWLATTFIRKKIPILIRKAKSVHA